MGLKIGILALLSQLLNFTSNFKFQSQTRDGQWLREIFWEKLFILNVWNIITLKCTYLDP